MNILLNVYPVQSGGGQQVASNFIKTIARNSYGHEWFFFVGESSELDSLAQKNFDQGRILAIPYSYSERFRSKKKLKKFVKDNSIDIIYNYSPVLPLKGLPQVVRSVYSNLYFPEIPFWVGYSWYSRFKKKIIDHFRLRGTLSASGLIFENEAMQERAVSLFRYPKSQTLYVAPSVSVFDTSQVNESFEKLGHIKEFKILYLSSWHLNKNIHLLPYVAKKLKERNCEVKFVLSLERNSSNVHTYVYNNIVALNVEEYFSFIGKVNAINVHQVVGHCDAMILLSKLECFSSNVVEAFYFGKPLIISDEEWARKACGDSACYVDRDEVDSIAEAVINISTNKMLAEKLIKNGKNRLASFNSPEEKVKKQIDFLEYIYKNK
ncbi:glycosyltransferase [Sphingobacterium thalpophilum]|uniref:glycosyltransferase n=1 Tax=Sphingobacterium thalpophilum TaxID=259 RepID=UPI0031E1FAE2